MKRSMPWNEHVDVISSDDSSSADAVTVVKAEPEEVESGRSMEIDQLTDEVKPDQEAANEVKPKLPVYEIKPEAEVVTGILFRKAVMYQEYMKKIKVPTLRGSVIPCNTWMELGKSLKQLYGQPLHYLTNIHLKELDLLRVGTYDECKPLDAFMHPCKAEASIWLTEEIHRSTTSPHQLVKLWTSDPLYHAYIDSLFPQLQPAQPVGLNVSCKMSGVHPCTV